MTERAAAEAIFGSISRGDGDSLSDRDILIVDSDTRLLSRRYATLQAAGWSVASYTFTKLEALAKKGALFIQHLRMESRIQQDAGGRLHALLAAFRPKNSYDDEIAENSRLAELGAVWPSTAQGALWAADVLYVATRNFGILLLASQRQYVFSYPDVLNRLVTSGVLSAEGFGALLQLRRAKVLYRSGQYAARAETEATVAHALSTLPSRFFPHLGKGMNPDQLLSKAASLPVGSPPYHKLRNLERAYISLMSTQQAPVASATLARLIRWVQNPRAYAAIARASECDLIDEMQMIRSARRRQARSESVQQRTGQWHVALNQELPEIAFPTAVRRLRGTKQRSSIGTDCHTDPLTSRSVAWNR